MRENRTYGSEGGEPGNRASLPLSSLDRSFFLDWGSTAGGALISNREPS